MSRSRKENFQGGWNKEEDTDIDLQDLINLALGAANGLAFLEAKKVIIVILSNIRFFIFFRFFVLPCFTLSYHQL